MSVDYSNASISDKWRFEPFQVPAQGELLKEQRLPDDFELILVERNGERRAFSMREMAYHHVAQGELGGVPFLVCF